MTVKQFGRAVSIKKLSLRRRFLGLTSLEQLKIRKSLKSLSMYLKIFKEMQDNQTGIYCKTAFDFIKEQIVTKALEEGDKPVSFNSACDPHGGFNIFGFIDNTVIAKCRPGGGPTADGPNAPKWQTTVLPNGMTFHAFGPETCRQNDLWMLRRSASWTSQGKNKTREPVFEDAIINQEPWVIITNEELEMHNEVV
eukprot:gene2529-4918_t